MATLLGKIIADFTTALSTDIAVGGTSATLASATDDDGNALPSGRYFFTLDGSNSSKEHISCDLVGTALTNIKSLSRQGVETTGAVRKHRIGASVSLTNHGHLKFINDLVSGTTTLNALAPLGYDAAPSSLTGNQLATVTYVLGVVNGGTVTFDKQVIANQTAGENLTANDIVYFKEADAKWWKVDADLTATFDQLQMGVAQATVLANGTVQIGISGPMSGFTGLTAGSKYYASNTAGAITTTAGTYSVFVGWALSTTILLFDSVGKTLPTQKEKDALVGSQGVPSSTNKYITQDNTSTAGTDQSQTTQNGTVEIGESDATSKKNKLAQSFIPVKTKIRGVNLYKSADTGTFTGTVTVSIQADSTGSPSGTPLATKTLTNLEWTVKPTGAFEIIFTSEYASLVAGSLYWIVVETSTSDSSNHPNIGTNTAGGYSNGSVKYKNTTDGWVAVSTIDLYFSTIEGNASQGVSTDTSGAIPLAFFDTSKMPAPAFHQMVPISADTTAQELTSFTSEKDGSAFYVGINASNDYLKRFARDSITGAYKCTHTESTLGFSSGGAGMVIVGDYLYVAQDTGATSTIYRYAKADLTGKTAMTGISIGATGSYINLFTDGTFIYIQENAGATFHKCSISGTVFTDTGTVTVAAPARGQYYTYMFDGSNQYAVNDTSANVDAYKFTARDGTTISAATNIWNSYCLGTNSLGSGGSQYYTGLVNIDTTRMYLVYHVRVFQESTTMFTGLYMVPVTKP